MVAYKCFGCGKVIEMEQVSRKIRCPYCSSKVVLKDRPPVKKFVKAR